MAAQRGKASARKARLSVAQPFAIHAEPPVRTGFARQYARTVRVSGCDERAASVQPADEPAHTFRTRASGLYGNPLENRPPNGPELAPTESSAQSRVAAQQFHTSNALTRNALSAMLTHVNARTPQFCDTAVE